MERGGCAHGTDAFLILAPCTYIQTQYVCLHFYCNNGSLQAEASSESTAIHGSKSGLS